MNRKTLAERISRVKRVLSDKETQRNIHERMKAYRQIYQPEFEAIRRAQMPTGDDYSIRVR